MEELYNRAREVDPESRELEEIQAQWYAHPKIKAMLDKMEAWNWGLVELLGISETTFGSELSLKGDPKKKWHVQIVDTVIKNNGSNKARFCINYSNPDAFKYENFVPDITVTDNNRRNRRGARAALLHADEEDRLHPRRVELLGPGSFFGEVEVGAESIPKIQAQPSASTP